VLPVLLRREHGRSLGFQRERSARCRLMPLKGASHELGLAENPTIAVAQRLPRIGPPLTSSPGHPLKSNSQTRVSSLSAAVCNVPETTRLLARVPHAAGTLSEKLAEPLLFQHWDDSTQCAIWIASDGTHVRCVTVTGLSVVEMADMWVSFGERISRARFNLSAQLVRDIIEAEIDVPVALVN
jgi:hypothetical protein